MGVWVDIKFSPKNQKLDLWGIQDNAYIPNEPRRYADCYIEDGRWWYPYGEDYDLPIKATHYMLIPEGPCVRT